MVLFPNAKINLGLNVLSRRPDGYHTIQSVFIPVELADILEVVPLDDGAPYFFQKTGIPVGGAARENLVVKALEQVRNEFDLPSVRIHLHKCIPPGSGLGGGSSDGAAMVMALDRIFDLKMSRERIRAHLLRLGSDCTFFLENTPCLIGGVGDRVRPIALDVLSGLWLVLVIPDLHISTARAYSRVQPNPHQDDLEERVRQPVHAWRNAISNDFETFVFEDHPFLGDLKATMYERGAIYASLSGSGSAVYGLFNQRLDLKGEFHGMRIWQGQVR